jgi:dTDP-4-dehydrorhamnose 3,5-epimerase
MIFLETALTGVVLIRPEPITDPRGSFARLFCRSEFEARGLVPVCAQSSVSLNTRKGTLRGIHFQKKPFEEAKLVRCLAGSVFDVAVDLRLDSPDYGRYVTAVLAASSGEMVYIPKGFGHGFQTLEPNTELLYFMSEFYSAEHFGGVRWDDPTLDIPWPEDRRTICERDRNLPLLDQLYPVTQYAGIL